MIYLDNAATTSLDREVFVAMEPYFTERYGNSQSQHGAGRQAAGAVQNVRDSIAGEIGCRPEEIYFVSGGTEGDNTALKGICAAKRKGHIIVSGIEHSALYDSALQMQEFGFDLSIVQPQSSGVILPEDIRAAIRPDTIFCGVMAANNETGVIQPVKEIGAVCREAGIFFFTDSVQAAPYLPIRADAADGLVFSAHKFYGPKGTAALYIKNGSRLKSLITGGMQERTLRGGTLNVPGIVGLGAAYKICVKNREVVNTHVKALRDEFIRLVQAEIPDTHINGEGDILPSHANISFDGCEGENIVFAMDLKGIACSTGAACSAGAVTPTRVISAMAGTERAKSAVRFSFGKYNTMEEVHTAVQVLKDSVLRIRTAR